MAQQKPEINSEADVRVAEMNLRSEDDIEKMMQEIGDLQKKMAETVAAQLEPAEDLVETVSPENLDSKPGPDFSQDSHPELSTLPSLSLIQKEGELAQLLPSVSSKSVLSVVPVQVDQVPNPETLADDSESPMNDSYSSNEEPWLEETLAALDSEPKSLNEEIVTDTDKNSVVKTELNDSEIRTQAVAAEAEAPSLAMEIKGKMTLELNHRFGGPQLRISFDSKVIQIIVSDGTELRIPVREIQSKK